MALVSGMVYRIFIEMKRYYLNFLSSIVVMIIIFLLIVLGFKSFGGSAASGTLRDTAIGYFMWMTMLFTLTDLSWTIMNEMQRGIIEQEFLSPYGPLAVFAAYQFSSILFNLPLLYGMMVVIFSLAGVSIKVPPVFFLYLVAAMIQTMGMGMMLAGITLRFKRTNALLQLVQFAVIGLLFLDARGFKAMIIPVSPYFYIMKKILSGESPEGATVLFALIGTAIYLAAGLLVFKFFERAVRIRGDLTTY